MEYGAQINFLLSETADHVILRKEKKKKGQGRKQQERKERARELTKACFNLTALALCRERSQKTTVQLTSSWKYVSRALMLEEEVSASTPAARLIKFS